MIKDRMSEDQVLDREVGLDRDQEAERRTTGAQGESNEISMD